jgi:MFS family permease
MLFYLITAATILNQMAFKGSKIVMSLFAMQQGADQFIVGTLISLYSLFPTLLAVYAGRLSDRLGPRIPMLVGALGLAAGCLLPFSIMTREALYVSATMIGFLYIFYTVPVQHLVGTFGGGERRTRNFSTFSLGIAMSTLLGPPLTGFSIDLVGHRLTYLFLGLIPVLPAVFLIFFARGLPRPTVDRRERKTTETTQRNKPLIRALVTAGIIETGLELFNFYMPIYGYSLGLSASAIGIVMGVFGAGVLLMRGAIPQLVGRYGEEGALFGSLSLTAIAGSLIPFTGSTYLLMAISFVFGLGLGCCTPLSMIITYNRAPDGHSGEAMGMRQTVNKFIQLLLPVVVGTLGSTFGVGPAFWLDSAILAVGSFLMKGDMRSRVRMEQEKQADVAR